MKSALLLLRTSLLGLACLTGAGAFAQRPPDEALLGLNERELQAAVPGLQRLRRPLAGPHGLRAFWALTEAQAQGGTVSTAFFVQHQQVAHIEQRWTASEDHCDAAARYAALSSQQVLRYGPGVDSGQEGQGLRSSAWAAGP